MSIPALRPFAPALYGLGIVMWLIALGDYASNVWPYRLDALEWRYGAMGILSNFLVTPTFGLLLVAAGAALARNRSLLWGVGLVSLAGCAALLVGTVLFSLDAVQMRQGANEGARWVTLVSASIAIAKHLLAATVLCVLGLGGLRAARALGTPGRDRAGLVVGA